MVGWIATLSNHPELANRLKDFRTASNLTQAELAERVMVSRKTINTIENGVFAPSVVLALRLADCLSCAVEELFELKPDKGREE